MFLYVRPTYGTSTGETKGLNQSVVKAHRGIFFTLVEQKIGGKRKEKEKKRKKKERKMKGKKEKKEKKIG